MIRRDYLMRLAQEMAQVLVRVVSLKHRKEYDQALREIGDALRQLREAEPNAGREASLQDWIGLCDKYEQAGPSMMTAVADLVREQGEIFGVQGRPAESQASEQIALGLFLEALLKRGAFVSAELLDKIESLIERTGESALASELSQRLIHYFTARGRLGKAEDVLFSWIETRDPAAHAEGRMFYQKLLLMDDDELVRGELPRAEVEEGLRDLTQRAAR